VVRLAAAQAALGHEVAVVSHAVLPQAEDAVRAAHARVPGVEKVRLAHIPTITRRQKLMGVKLAGPARELVESASVAHLHGVWDPIILAAARVAAKGGVRYVVAPHGMLDPWS